MSWLIPCQHSPSAIFSPNIYMCTHILLPVFGNCFGHCVCLVLWLPQRETRGLIPLHALLRFSTSPNVSVNLFPVATHGVYVILQQDTLWRGFLSVVTEQRHFFPRRKVSLAKYPLSALGTHWFSFAFLATFSFVPCTLLCAFDCIKEPFR